MGLSTNIMVAENKGFVLTTIFGVFYCFIFCYTNPKFYLYRKEEQKSRHKRKEKEKMRGKSQDSVGESNPFFTKGVELSSGCNMDAFLLIKNKNR